ncbi:hypothetical protein DEU56DRAFT_947103 [Suillus clintonianus]|uniref:uncharacterized protein n=1 Tax=Suillus clintonianus TaxID=1904413 RepID=UPI001B8735E8|nr:uncharacterized protein DEU56DRAFT_947103 [Suillus clintonianus]KAG2136418.1 hypothetical protein DEU56DRAFT_947103 [Suillus clintonianus]
MAALLSLQSSFGTRILPVVVDQFILLHPTPLQQACLPHLSAASTTSICTQPSFLPSPPSVGDRFSSKFHAKDIRERQHSRLQFRYIQASLDTSIGVMGNNSTIICLGKVSSPVNANFPAVFEYDQYDLTHSRNISPTPRHLPLALSHSTSYFPREQDPWLIWGRCQISVRIALSVCINPLLTFWPRLLLLSVTPSVYFLIPSSIPPTIHRATFNCLLQRATPPSAVLSFKSSSNRVSVHDCWPSQNASSARWAGPASFLSHRGRTTVHHERSSVSFTSIGTNIPFTRMSWIPFFAFSLRAATTTHFLQGALDHAEVPPLLYLRNCDRTLLKRKRWYRVGRGEARREQVPGFSDDTEKHPASVSGISQSLHAFGLPGLWQFLLLSSSLQLSLEVRNLHRRLTLWELHNACRVFSCWTSTTSAPPHSHLIVLAGSRTQHEHAGFLHVISVTLETETLSTLEKYSPTPKTLRQPSSQPSKAGSKVAYHYYSFTRSRRLRPERSFRTVSIALYGLVELTQELEHEIHVHVLPSLQSLKSSSVAPLKLSALHTASTTHAPSAPPDHTQAP